MTRSGCVTASAMFEWKAAADGCLDRWTRGDVRAFLPIIARAASNDPRRAMDTATCVRDVAHGAGAEAEAERPGDSWIHQAAGRRYEAAGMRELALSWRTRGLHQALRSGEADLIGILLEDRGVDDLLAADAAAFLDAHEWCWHAPIRPGPRPGSVPEARSWPGFRPPIMHARWRCGPASRGRREHAVRHVLRPAGAGAPEASPRRRARARDRPTRHRRLSRLVSGPALRTPNCPTAAWPTPEALGDRGAAVTWPPGRNDPCWCASGRKYKKCCLSAA